MVAQQDAEEAADQSIEELIMIEPTTGLKILPHWLAQPYFRPLNSKHPEREPTLQKVSHTFEYLCVYDEHT